MSPAPYQPIPDSTQPFVDRLIGSMLGAYRVQERVHEGRYGTLYRAQQPGSGEWVTIQVLRTGLVGHDEEVRAVNAIRCAGVATASAFGDVPDGRHYRVFEPLDGESLEQQLQRRGRLLPRETAQVLAQVAGVLEAAHAWAIAHGCLGASSVFLVGSTVKLIDYGLAKQRATPAEDLRDLGLLGFTLLTGKDVEGHAPPPGSAEIPRELDRLLRDLVEQRFARATFARKDLEEIQQRLESPMPAPPKPSRRSSLIAALGVVAVAAVGGLAYVASTRAPVAESPVTAVEEAEAAAALDELANEAPEELSPEDGGVSEVVEPTGTPVPRPPPRPPKMLRRVPTAQALTQQISRLEVRLRREARAGQDLDQALFMLNKQRLRLTGAPTEQERLDVARQLAGWRRSYLRP